MALTLEGCDAKGAVAMNGDPTAGPSARKRDERQPAMTLGVWLRSRRWDQLRYFPTDAPRAGSTHAPREVHNENAAVALDLRVDSEREVASVSGAVAEPRRHADLCGRSGVVAWNSA